MLVLALDVSTTMAEVLTVIHLSKAVRSTQLSGMLAAHPFWCMPLGCAGLHNGSSTVGARVTPAAGQRADHVHDPSTTHAEHGTGTLCSGALPQGRNGSAYVPLVSPGTDGSVCIVLEHSAGGVARARKVALVLGGLCGVDAGIGHR
jgi:hypothetical protein